MQSQKEPLSAAKCGSNTLPKRGIATLAPTQESPAAPLRAREQSLAILIPTYTRAFQDENLEVGGRKGGLVLTDCLVESTSKAGPHPDPLQKDKPRPNREQTWNKVLHSHVHNTSLCSSLPVPGWHS